MAYATIYWGVSNEKTDRSILLHVRIVARWRWRKIRKADDKKARTRSRENQEEPTAKQKASAGTHEGVQRQGH